MNRRPTRRSSVSNDRGQRGIQASSKEGGKWSGRRWESSKRRDRVWLQRTLRVSSCLLPALFHTAPSMISIFLSTILGGGELTEVFL